MSAAVMAVEPNFVSSAQYMEMNPPLQTTEPLPASQLRHNRAPENKCLNKNLRSGTKRSRRAGNTHARSAQWF